MNNYKLRITQNTKDTETTVTINANKDGYFSTTKVFNVSDKAPIVMEYVKYEGDTSGYGGEILKTYDTFSFYAYVEDRIAQKLKDYSTNKEDYAKVTYSDPSIKWIYDSGEYSKTQLGYFTLSINESYVNEQELPKTKIINGVNCTCLLFYVSMISPDFEYKSEHPTQLTLTLMDPENISKPNSFSLDVTVIGAGKFIDSPPTDGITNEELIYTISADQWGWTFKDGVWNPPSDWYNKYVDLPVKCVMSNSSGESYTWYGWSRPFINLDETDYVDTQSWNVVNTHRPAIGYSFPFGKFKNTGFFFDYSGYGSSIYMQCYTEDGQPHPVFNYGSSYTNASNDGFKMDVYKLTY